VTNALEICSDTLRCEIAPEMGGSIAGLWMGDIPVLRSTSATELTGVRRAGSFPLVPFSNRVGHATLTWAGTSHTLVPTTGDEPHAIHGVGWQHPWQVLEADSHSARLSYTHQADDSWPFAFEAFQTFRLNGNELILSLSIQNQSAVQAPVGLGWHPYFVKRKCSQIFFQATGRWEMNAEKLPTHSEPSQGLDTDCAVLDVDHCYDGWPGVVELRDEKLHTRISSSLNHLVVFTRPEHSFVAIEPVSHVNNAINLINLPGACPEALGLRVLEPEESMSADMRVRVERVN